MNQKKETKNWVSLQGFPHFGEMGSDMPARLFHHFLLTQFHSSLAAIRKPSLYAGGGVTKKCSMEICPRTTTNWLGWSHSSSMFILREFVAMSTGNGILLKLFEVEDRKVKFKDGTLRDLQPYTIYAKFMLFRDMK